MDELVQSPVLRGGRRLPAAILGLCGLILGGTGAMDALSPASAVVPVGQEARDLAAARRERRWIDGSAADWVEAELKSRSRVRRAVAPYWSAFLMKSLGAVPEELVLGSEGWMFLRRRLVPPAGTRGQGIDFAATACAAFQRRLAQRGARAVVMPVPRKVVACAERLPDGVDPDASYDVELVAALVERGVTTIDVLGAWKKLSPEERYLRRDSHWAFPGEVALADRVAERFPRLVASGRRLDLRRVEIPAPSELLEFASIHWNHPVVPLVARDMSTRPVLSPKSAVQELRRKSTDVAVAVVGSSFTRKFNFDHLMAHTLNRMVYPGGVAASTFGGSLASFAKHFDGGPYPPHVLYEFPVHQSFSLGRRGVSSRRSLASFFVNSSAVAVQAVPLNRLSLPQPLLRAEATQLRLPAGTLLSTGDGVLQLKIRLASGGRSEWDLASGGLSQRWQAGPGPSEAILPVLQPRAGGGAVTFHKVSGDSRAHVESIEVVTDVDWEASDVVQMVPTETGYEARLAAELAGFHDALLVTWEGEPADVHMVVEGTTPAGEPRQIHARFPAPVSSLAVLGLGQLRGGTIDTVRLEGKVEGAAAAMARQIVR